MSSLHPIMQGVMCSFGMHEWKPAPVEKHATKKLMFKHLECKHCPVKRIEEWEQPSKV